LAARIGSLVHVRERFSERHAERNGFGPADAYAELAGSSSYLAKVFAFDVFDDHVRFAVRIRRSLENLRNARVMQLGLDAGLVEKPRQKRFVSGVLAPNDFDDTWAFGSVDAPSGREENLAHAAASHLLEQREALEWAR
jgi:hypothetical protein